MKNTKLIVLALLLAGCAQMTNQEIISQTHLCQRSGLIPVARYHPLDGSVSRVTCVPANTVPGYRRNPGVINDLSATGN